MSDGPIAVEFQAAENGYVLQFWEPSAPGRYEAVAVSSQRIFVAVDLKKALQTAAEVLSLHFKVPPEQP